MKSKLIHPLVILNGPTVAILLLALTSFFVDPVNTYVRKRITEFPLLSLSVTAVGITSLNVGYLLGKKEKIIAAISLGYLAFILYRVSCTISTTEFLMCILGVLSVIAYFSMITEKKAYVETAMMAVGFILSVAGLFLREEPISGVAVGITALFLSYPFIFKSFRKRGLLFTLLYILGVLPYKFRADILMIIAMYVVLMFLENNKIGGLKLFLCGLIAIAIIVFMGYLKTPYSRLNPFTLLLYREGLFLYYLEKTCRESVPLGYGVSIWSTREHPTWILGKELFKVEKGITTGLFGPLVFDGGILEVIVASLVVGGVLKSYYSRRDKYFERCAYSILAAMVVIAGEVGFNTIEIVCINIMVLSRVIRDLKVVKEARDEFNRLLELGFLMEGLKA